MNKNIKYSQNFLTSEKVLNQIIKQLNLKETDTVYEIGTGKGHLTTKLAKISKQVTSIELDSHLFNLSSEKLKLNTRVTLIHQDILQFQFPNKQRYKIVGNIPYHLSTQIIKKVVFESRASDIYLIVEEGFYKRTLDIHRTLGLLLHTQVSIQQLLKLPAECFHPKPKVNSVLIKLTRHTTDVPDKYWKLYTYFVSKYTDIELTFKVYDSNDWSADPVGKETIHVYPYGEENAVAFVREAQATDNVIIDNDYVTVIVTGYEDDEIWGYTANLFLLNKTDKTVMFSVDDASVNGFMADPFYATSVSAGKCAFSSMAWSDTTLEENGITEVEEIEVLFRAYDADDFMGEDFANEVITLNP